jgi:hypothetical protein
VAVPSYDGKIPIEVVNSLFGLQQLIHLNQGRMSFIYQRGMALVQSARNALLAEIMKYPDVTGVLHLDADIEFDPMDALSLIAYADDKYDVMAGLYRAKTDKSFWYYVTYEGPNDPVLDGEVLPCKRVPLGFAYVKRKVLDARGKMRRISRSLSARMMPASCLTRPTRTATSSAKTMISATRSARQGSGSAHCLGSNSATSGTNPIAGPSGRPSRRPARASLRSSTGEQRVSRYEP